jgi:hypothetical protein
MSECCGLLVDGCKQNKHLFIGCLNSDFKMLQYMQQEVPSICFGCKNTIVIDLDEDKAAAILV